MIVTCAPISMATPLVRITTQWHQEVLKLSDERTLYVKPKGVGVSIIATPMEHHKPQINEQHTSFFLHPTQSSKTSSFDIFPSTMLPLSQEMRWSFLLAFLHTNASDPFSIIIQSITPPQSCVCASSHNLPLATTSSTSTATEAAASRSPQIGTRNVSQVVVGGNTNNGASIIPVYTLPLTVSHAVLCSGDEGIWFTFPCKLNLSMPFSIEVNAVVLSHTSADTSIFVYFDSHLVLQESIASNSPPASITLDRLLHPTQSQNATVIHMLLQNGLLSYRDVVASITLRGTCEQDPQNDVSNNNNDDATSNAAFSLTDPRAFSLLIALVLITTAILMTFGPKVVAHARSSSTCFSPHDTLHTAKKLSLYGEETTIEMVHVNDIIRGNLCSQTHNTECSSSGI
eukprot:m.74590 g.74590  ORF g.74590 m.74590 type:complete len:400 (-) comp8455_c0_seq1:151-1350(-)